MTLVAAYERLIGERGTELADPSVVATADPTSTGSASPTTRIEPDRPRRTRPPSTAAPKPKRAAGSSQAPTAAAPAPAAVAQASVNSARCRYFEPPLGVGGCRTLEGRPSPCIRRCASVPRRRLRRILLPMRDGRLIAPFDETRHRLSVRARHHERPHCGFVVPDGCRSRRCYARHAAPGHARLPGCGPRLPRRAQRMPDEGRENTATTATAAV